MFPAESCCREQAPLSSLEYRVGLVAAIGLAPGQEKKTDDRVKGCRVGLPAATPDASCDYLTVLPHPDRLRCYQPAPKGANHGEKARHQ